MNCIDNLDFDQSTRKKSFQMREEWIQRNGANQNSKWLLNFFNNQQTKFDISTLIRIKLSIILFELHSRLTSYNYFVRTTTPAPSGDTVPSADTEEQLTATAHQHPQIFTAEYDGQSTSRDDLNSHYSRLPKDKRQSLVTWIWTTLNRMNIFVCLDSVDLVEYLEELSTHLFDAA